MSGIDKLSAGRMQRQTGLMWAVSVIAATTTLLMVPFLLKGNIVGHDFTFHLQLWLEAARQWREGIFYPHWAEPAGFGHGDLRFMFYPPLSWMLGGLLSLIFPVYVAPLVFMCVTLIGSGVTSFLAVREIAGFRAAIWAAAIYVSNPYHALILYRRSDYAELLASAIFPLAVFYLWRLSREGKGFLGFSLCVCALWLSNLPAALIATYVLALMLLVLAILGEIRDVVRGFLALMLGIGAAAFFLMPATYEQRWVTIGEVIKGESDPAVNFLFQPPAAWMTNAGWWYRYNLLVSLTASSVICLGIVAWILSKDMRARHWRVAAMLTTAGCWCAVMMFSISHPIWLIMPKLRFVQFPWRFMLPLTFVTTVFIACARVARRWTILAFVPTLAVIGVIGAYARTWDGNIVASALVASYPQGYEAPPEYVPLNTQDRTNPDGDPALRLSTPGTRAAIVYGSAERSVLSVQSPSATDVTLRRAWYPAWRGQIDGRDAALSRDDHGDVTIRVPAGFHTVSVEFTRTWDQRAGEVISLASLAALITLAFSERRAAELGRKAALDVNLASGDPSELEPAKRA